VGLAFTPDGGLQLADAKGNISLWDTKTGNKRRSFACNVKLDESVTRPSAWFQAEGKVMAWDEAGTVRPWDLATGQEKPRLGMYRHGIQWAGFSSDGRVLRAAGANDELGVWDAVTGRPHPVPHRAETIIPTTGPIRGTSYNPALDRSKVIITGREGSSGGRIVLWDPAGPGPIPLDSQVGPAWSAILTPDNRFVVAAEERGQIRVYDAAGGKPVRAFDGREHQNQLAFSPSGRLLATTGGKGAVLYDFAEGRTVRELENRVGNVGENRFSAGSCIAFSPDGRTLATGHYADAFKQATAAGDMICLWDVGSGRELRRIPTDHQDISAVCFSPNGALIASCGFDAVVKVWEAASGQERRRYEGHQHQVHSVDFAPDGRRLASGSADGTALVWQIFDPAPADRTIANLDAIWADLAKDGRSAHRAMGALLAAKDAPAYLAKRLKPAVQPTEEEIKRWLADMSSPQFQTRLGAQKELTDHVDLIETRLRRALETSPDLETQRRLATVLKSIPLENRPEQLRELRAVEVLGHIGTAEARRVLEELAKGAPEGNLTRQAQACLTLDETDMSSVKTRAEHSVTGLARRDGMAQGPPAVTATRTVPASTLGSGTGSPRRSKPSTWNSIASRIKRSTCLRVFPVAIQPGRSGT
jgi:WD40 repeat protein